MNYIKCFLAAIIIFIAATGCSEDPIIVNKTNVVIGLLDPSEEIKITEFLDVKITLTNLNTQEVAEQQVTENTVEFEVNQGNYEVAISGKVMYSFNGVVTEGNVAAIFNELNLIVDEQRKDIKLSLKSFGDDFIIEEIFFTGSLTPEGAPYGGDKYFKLYNNTDKTLYADGLIIAESSFKTVEKFDYTPNVMAQDFTTRAVSQIPGSGTEYPVAPGSSLIIAVNGINHIENNAASVDLSGANFEFFYENSGDVDATQVPNLINVYGSFLNHSRGFYGYVIARLPEGVTRDSYLADYGYDFEYLFVFNGGSFPFNDSGYRLPNDWVLDAVNLSVETIFQWVVTDPSLDSGYTYCGKFDRDDARFGKSVRRRVVQEIDGVRLLQDTNNSALDFIPEASLSLK